MAVSQYEFTGKRPLRLKEMSTDGKADGVHKADKPAILAKTRENLAKIAQWQEKLYAAWPRGRGGGAAGHGRGGQGQHHQARDGGA